MTAVSGGLRGTLSGGTRLKLSMMMFLEFFIWGAWFVTMGSFLARELSASGSQISLAYLTQSLGAIAAPFIIGLIAVQSSPHRRFSGSCTWPAPRCYSWPPLAGTSAPSSRSSWRT